jgi:hypothetical protein
MKNQSNLDGPTAAKILVIYAIGLAALTSLVGLASAAESSRASDAMEEEPIEAIEGKVVDGFFMGLTGDAPGTGYSTNNTSTDDPIIYVIWTTGNPAWIAVPAEPEQAFRIELLDTNGLPVPKTDVCRKIGTKFYDFGQKDKVKHFHVNKKGKGTAAPYLLLPDDPRALPWPNRPSDLFKIPGPGRYTLRIWFQIVAFPSTGPGRKDYTRDLIRFPPLDYPLVTRPRGLTNAVEKASGGR